MAKKKQKGLDTAEVADMMWDAIDTPRIVNRRGSFYLYEDGIHRKAEDGEIKKLALEFTRNLPGQPTPSAQFVNAVVEGLAHRTFIDGTKNAPFQIVGLNGNESSSLLVCKNGVLDLSPMYGGSQPALIPHSPHLFAVSKTNYDYDPGAECPLFLDWLDRFTCDGDGDVDEDVKILIAEIICYILLRDLNYHKLFVFVGDGANGKSVLLKTITMLIGKDACSSFALERLGQRFAMSGLVDCAVNICGDVGTTSKVSEGLLKQLVDGSLVESEAKFKPSVSTRNQTRLLFATNNMWRILDNTDGMWRRIVFIECLAKISAAEKVNDIEKRFVPELPGILNWVLSHAPALIARGDFIEPEACKRALLAERSDANSIMAWLENCVHVDGETFVGPKHPVYLKYASWAEDRGYKAVGAYRFHKELKRLMKPHIDGGKVKMRVRGVARGEPTRGWSGFKITTSEDEGGVYFDKQREEAEREQTRQMEAEREARREAAMAEAAKLEAAKRDTTVDSEAEMDRIMVALGSAN